MMLPLQLVKGKLHGKLGQAYAITTFCCKTMFPNLTSFWAFSQNCFFFYLLWTNSWLKYKQKQNKHFLSTLGSVCIMVYMEIHMIWWSTTVQPSSHQPSPHWRNEKKPCMSKKHWCGQWNKTKPWTPTPSPSTPLSHLSHYTNFMLWSNYLGNR